LFSDNKCGIGIRRYLFSFWENYTTYPFMYMYLAFNNMIVNNYCFGPNIRWEVLPNPWCAVLDVVLHICAGSFAQVFSWQLQVSEVGYLILG